MIKNKPWGSFKQFTQDEISTVKILFIERGHRTSLQVHKKRDEFWYIISGSVKIDIGGSVVKLFAEETIEIPKLTQHRVQAITDAKILEISKGMFDENDIVRLEDDYGRK